MSALPQARLCAIIAVDVAHAVRCQQPGCGHRVHAAVHIVREGEEFIVLGSSCYAKRYGNNRVLGNARYGGGTGRSLTDDERRILEANTAALIAYFEEEERAAQAAEQRRIAEQKVIAERQAQLRRVQYRQTPHTPPSPTQLHRSITSPWPWQSARHSSVAVLYGPCGKTWVRVQHQDGSQKLIPWPAFEGWEKTLPSTIGNPDFKIQGYGVNDIVQALSMLRSLGYSEPRIGNWREVLPRLQK